MEPYSVRDVEKLANLPRRSIRSLVAAGLVSPERGPRNAWRFSFQDLIVFRSAQALLAANVPHRRITRSVRELKRRLPESMPLSGLNISAEHDRVVVREGDRCWQADSGQYLLGFESGPTERAVGLLEQESGSAHESSVGPLEQEGGSAHQSSVGPLEQESGSAPASAEEWFERGAALESHDTHAALEAYERAASLDPGLLKARVNLGRLLHETGRLDRAEAVYREAMRAHSEDPVLLYDLGVLLDDIGRKSEAMDAYEAALRADPLFADCHYNLALLYEGLGRPKDAIQHMSAYLRLTTTTGPE